MFHATLGLVLLQVLAPQVGGDVAPEIVSLNAGIVVETYDESMVIGANVGIVIAFPVTQYVSVVKEKV